MTQFVPKTYTIDLKSVNNYTNILKLFSQNNIQVYVYTITWKNIIIKYGISHKNGSTRQLGDRIYTQAGYFPGWDKKCLDRGPKSKAATEAMIAKLEKTYKVTFHKNDVVLTIEDYTDYPFENDDNPYAELQNVEEQKKKEFYNKHQCYPVGNKKQEKIRSVPLFKKTGLFEFL